MTHLRHPQTLRSLPPAGGAAVRMRMGWNPRPVSNDKRTDDAGTGTYSIFS